MSHPPTFIGELVEVRRNPWITGLAATPFLATLASIVAGAVVRPDLVTLALPTAILGVLLSTDAWRSNWRASVVSVTVRAGEDGVMLGDRLVPRDSIRAGFVEPLATPRVRLHLRSNACASHVEAASVTPSIYP